MITNEELNIKQLPCEVLSKICRYVGNVKHFAMTCKLFSEIVRDNRVIRFNTFKCISNFDHIGLDCVIPLNDKVIIITRSSRDVKKILVLNKNNILLCRYRIINRLDQYIISRVINNTIIILIYYGTYYNERELNYTYNFTFTNIKVILMKIFAKYFKEYNYKIIYVNYFNGYDPMLQVVVDIKVHENNKNINSHELLCYMRDYPIHVDNEHVYFSDKVRTFSYNFYTGDRKPLNGSYKKTYTYLLKTLDITDALIIEVVGFFKKSINFKGFIVTDKYLAISYSNQNETKDYITVFKLNSDKRSTIYVKFNSNYKKCAHKKGLNNNSYNIRHLHKCNNLNLCGIYGNYLYISRFRRKSKFQTLYKVKLM